MFKSSRKPVANRLSIDLGGFHTRIFHEEEGLILDEPSVGLLDMDHQYTGARATACFGEDALERGTLLSGTRLIQPLQADCQNNLGYSAKMVRYFLSKLRRNRLIGKAPIVLLAVPQGITQQLSDDLRHACFTAGASRVHLVDNSIAAAVGTGLAIEEPTPHLLMDIGARSARLYGFQHNELVFARDIPLGGDQLDEILVNGIRERYGLHVSNSQAQKAKHQVGCAMTSSFGHQLRNSCQMKGLQIFENTNTNFTLTTEVACELLRPAMQHAADVISDAIASAPYSFRDAQHDTAVVLCGGGSQFIQIDQLIMEASGKPVEIANRPLSAGARGGATMLSRIHGTAEEAEPA
jgi:rod shape-determining protein MreB